MATWSHFLSDPSQAKQVSDCFRTTSIPASTSTSLGVVVSPDNFDPLTESVVLRTLSSEMPVTQIPKPVVDATEPNPIPRRNLMEAFEELHIKPTDTPAFKTSKKEETLRNSIVSPTGVSDLESPPETTNESLSRQSSSVVTPEKEESRTSVPSFQLHPKLKRELSDALVNRVSFYAVIHDINKEATSMAANDDSGYHRNPEEMHEEHDPLVVAVNGPPSEALGPSNSILQSALIDEERWLLDAIDCRSKEESRSISACPPTFLQAIGERDYENPLTSLSNGSRTQLWKPSRSWWEAKSGKNPWIEPKSHNKRWRYLWPLIHYHKFLARCIKKLKRNGVDVKTSVSPVSVFLREEVCAVSDHLASVSMFDSDEWMHCLEFFHGWVPSDSESEALIREMVASLCLRPILEPGDVDSPLLRSQIDEQYLRAMATARAQMAGSMAQEERQPRSGKPHTSSKSRKSRDEAKINPVQPMILHTMGRQPPVYPRQSNGNLSRTPGRMSGTSPSGGSQSRPWGYIPDSAQWWGNNWGHGGFFADDGSVHSGPAAENYPHPYDISPYDGPIQQAPYYPPMMYPQHAVGPGQMPVPFDPIMHDRQSVYGVPAPDQWGNQPIPNMSATERTMPGTPSAAVSTHESQEFNAQMDCNRPLAAPQMSMEQSPFKFNAHQVPMSPYWGHLDHATLAMMGIASPQGGGASPQTPARGLHTNAEDMAQQPENNAYAINAQPLLLRQQYYGFAGYGAREGYGPPSPATQFMMSPQASFAYSYGYGTSPRNPTSHRKRHGSSPHLNEQGSLESNNNSASSMTPTRGMSDSNRASPQPGGPGDRAERS
eukprot:scaffold10201_cov119-Cylindrotheca_fusiformis.AAC.13